MLLVGFLFGFICFVLVLAFLFVCLLAFRCLGFFSQKVECFLWSLATLALGFGRKKLGIRQDFLLGWGTARRIIFLSSFSFFFFCFCFVCAWLLQELLLQIPWKNTAGEQCQSRRQATPLAWPVVFWGITQTKENTVHLTALIKECLTSPVQAGSVLHCSQSRLGPSCSRAHHTGVVRRKSLTA